MNTNYPEIEDIRDDAIRLRLIGYTLLVYMPLEVLASAYNGTGPEFLPQKIRDKLDAAAPIHEALVEQKNRPIVNLFLSVDPDNANDRKNLTMVCLSNESAKVESGISFRTWWFANAVLTSAPIMGLKVFTDYNTRSYEIPGTWASYGTNGVTIVDGDGEYETYELDFTLPGTNTPHNLSIYLRPWAVINPDFDFGNRQRRHNGELCTTTNSLAFLGSFYYTNMTEITTHFPYADRGKLKWEEVKEDE